MLDDRQKRTFIALACKVAWADGVVEPEERIAVAALVTKLGGTPVTPEELDEWLATGAPAAEVEDLAPELGEMLIYEAMKLVESDHDMSDSELEMVEALAARVAKKHEPEMPLAKVAKVILVKPPS